MLLRYLIIILVLASAVRTAAAQAQRVELRDHPVGATEVLWSAPSSFEGVYRSDGDLLFTSRNGTRKVRLEGTTMGEEISASGSRVGVLLKTLDDAPLQLRVFGRDGLPEMSHEVHHHGDDPLPQLALSNVSGDVVYARPATAEVCFVQDAVSDCLSLFADAAYTHERNVFVDVSPDGRHVVIAAQREPAQPELSAPDANAYLFLFDRHGTLIWRRPLPQPAVRSLGFAPTSFIVVSTYEAYGAPQVLQQSRVVNLEGETVADAPHGADAFAYVQDEILLITKRQVAAITGSEGSSRLVRSASSGREVVAAGGGAGGVVVLTGRRVFTDRGFAFDDLRLLHLNEDGMLIGEDDVPASPQRSPRVGIDAERRQTVLILDRETHLYSRPR